MDHAFSVRFERPFWPVTLVSGALAVSTFAGLLVVYGLSGRWQFLALGGIVTLIIAAHGLAWWLARERDRFDLGIWLIAVAQILSAILAPLFMADYWIIGPFLLIVGLVEVGVADELRRMPLFAVLTLLGAAGMVAADLLAPFDRLTILADLPMALFLVVVLLGLHLAGLTFLLWRFRLRPEAGRYVRLDVATQQSLAFTAISAASIVVVTGVLIGQIRTSQIAQVGQSFRTLAEINAERVGNSLEQQIDVLRTLGRQSAVLLDGLAAANAEYPASPAEAERSLRDRERRWQTSPENSPFILEYRNNPLTLELSRFRGADLLHNNVFLTDRLGGLVAAQGEKPPRFYFGDEAWWQAAWNEGQGGIYLGDLAFDPETSAGSIFIAVGVLDPQTNRTVGVLASTYQLGAIQRDINLAKTRIAGEVRLLAPDGTVIAGPDEQAIGRPAWPSLLASSMMSPASPDEPEAESAWVLGIDGLDKPAVLGQARLRTTSRVNLDLLHDLGWQVVVSDTQANALAQVTRSTKVASLVGLLVMALVVVAATATARVITRPIEALTTIAAAISAGNLDQRAEPVGPVELVTLAESFNTLTARQRDLISSLQDQVAQRTAQLEARVEQLATLNRITQTVASVRDLQAALEIVSREMVQLFDARSSGIALLNSTRTELTLVTNYSRDEDQASGLGLVIPLAGNPSSIQVVETGQPIVVAQAQTSPLTAPIHDTLRARGTHCLMLLPLLARGEVIGTIGIASNQPERIFTPAEVALAETVAGQIAGAIDNSRLFERLAADKQRLELLYLLGQELSMRVDPEQVYTAIHQAVAQLMTSEAFAIALLDEAKQEIELAYMVDRRQHLPPVRFPAGQGLSGHVIATGQPLYVEDFEAEPNLYGVHFGEAQHVRSALAVPLRRGAKAFGVMTTQSYKPHAYTPDDQRTLGTLAAQAAIAIENALLFEETQKAKEAAEAANEAKSTFLANVSHELRTPLTSVLGFAKIIRKRLQERVFPQVPGEDQRALRAMQQVTDNLDIIVAEGERLTTLINDVLDLAKIEAGKVAWQMEPLAVADVIDRAIVATAALFESKDLALLRDVEPELPQIVGDRDRLIQVLINLISNAVKFTDTGTVVCRAQATDHEIVVSVKDTGAGIAEADQPKVFEKFTQVGDTLTGKPHGTGLGLPICKQIVEHHGGRIWLESQLGRGSTFSFSLPLNARAQP